MAINFSKSLSTSNLLNAYNNNVVEFSSDNVLDSVKCEIVINGNSFEISPINNVFRFNFKEVVSVLINQNKFVDAVVPSLELANSDSLIYDDTVNTYLSEDVEYTITFSNESTETTTENYKFLKSVEQLEAYKGGMYSSDKPIYILSPFKEGTVNTYNLTYNEGYPFDISIYLANIGNLTLLNETNGMSYVFDMQNTINRLFFSDGRTTITIADYLPLVNGLNELKLTSGTDVVYLNITKIDSKEGQYIKWLNEKGGWNYWLFNCVHKRERTTKSLGEVNNDSNDVSETTSPFYSLGRTSTDELILRSNGVEADDKLVLNYLADSPSVYYFTGLRYSQVNDVSWVACKFNTKKTTIINYKKSIANYKFNFTLPQRYTMTL